MIKELKMNRMLRNAVALLLCCGASFMSSCYVQAQESSTDKVYISGHVVNNKETIGKSVVKVYGTTFTMTPLRERGEGYDDSLDTKNSFSFEFDQEYLFDPNIGELGVFNIALIPENREFQMVLTNYPVEPGDSIYITLKTGKTKEEEEVSFTGRGAAKYRCRREIQEVLLRQEWIVATVPVSKTTVQDFRKAYQFQLEREKKAFNILQKYKDSVSERAYSLLKGEIMARILQRKLAIFYGYYKGSNIPKKELLKFVRNKDTGAFEIQELYDKDDAYLTLSYSYAGYLLTNTALGLYMKRGENPLFQDVAEAVMNNYSGKTMEFMLVRLAGSYFDPFPFFTSNYESATNEVYNNFIDSAMAVVKTPFIRQQMEYKSRVKTGMQAYNFAFTNPSGKLVKLEDFRGKTVLMDIWGTGCGGCADLAAYIKKHIKPEFGDDDDFVVVSINTDKKKERWLKSLASELYSEKEDINLNTNGKGASDENSKYYRVTGHPFSLLIDKNGKVVSYFSKDQDPKKAKMLIREAMRIPLTEGK